MKRELECSIDPRVGEEENGGVGEENGGVEEENGGVDPAEGYVYNSTLDGLDNSPLQGTYLYYTTLRYI